MFTHRILHWRSRGNPNSPQVKPRIAISFVCSDPSFEGPYLDPKYLSDEATPPLRIRLLLVCAQLLIYYQRFDLPKECIRTCYSMCKESEDELDEAYRQKVMVEFVKAVKEINTKESEMAAESEGAVPSREPSADSEGEDDAMLEVMLDAEAAGYSDDFEDDFDEAVNAVEADTCSHTNSSNTDQEDDFPFATDKRRSEEAIVSGEEKHKKSRLV
jgi:hypothetical protein